MKLKALMLSITAVVGLTGLTGCNQGEQVVVADQVPTEDGAKQSYGLGMFTSKSFEQLPIELQLDYFIAGLLDGLKGEQKLTDEELTSVLSELNRLAQEKAIQQQQVAMEKMQAEGEKFAAEGKAYLASNLEKEGVVATESGLQYKVVTLGEGEKPSVSDTVTVHYTGRLTDGTVFDSSVERGQPATFPLSGVIAGWTEGLQLMPVGSTYEFTIPAELAYGERGAPPSIPPQSVLVFDVELISIQK